jgi:TonB family protein
MKSFNATVFVFAVLSGFASRNALLAQETANLQSEHTKTVGISQPVVLNSLEASNSVEALRRHLEGDCWLSLIVDINGNPQDIQVLKCTDAEIDQLSLDSVSKYRFKPATRPDGTPVRIPIAIQVSFSLGEGNRSKSGVIYSIQGPVNSETAKAGTDGVLHLTEEMQSPVLSKFVDEGFSSMASNLSKASSLSNQPYCNVLLSIDANGKPFNPKAMCNDATLEQPAIDSLLHSHYKPGKINGRQVPIRISAHLKF